MGLFDKLKAEFIDIVEWLDPTNNVMVHRFDRRNNELKNGAKLTVRETQVAVFINEGQLADVFKPGMYTLTTENLPILATLKGWKYGFNSPFKAEVYFLNTKNGGFPPFSIYNLKSKICNFLPGVFNHSIFTNNINFYLTSPFGFFV